MYCKHYSYTTISEGLCFESQLDWGPFCVGFLQVILRCPPRVLKICMFRLIEDLNLFLGMSPVMDCWPTLGVFPAFVRCALGICSSIPVRYIKILENYYKNMVILEMYTKKCRHQTKTYKIPVCSMYLVWAWPSVKPSKTPGLSDYLSELRLELCCFQPQTHHSSDKNPCTLSHRAAQLGT